MRVDFAEADDGRLPAEASGAGLFEATNPRKANLIPRRRGFSFYGDLTPGQLAWLEDLWRHKGKSTTALTYDLLTYASLASRNLVTARCGHPAVTSSGEEILRLLERI